MKLSQSVTYGVHAVLRLAEENCSAPLSCAKLAEIGQMPERFLLQILRDLARQGILNSTRGGGGGFRLARNPREISVLSVIEAVEGPLSAGLPMRANFPQPAATRLEEVLRAVASRTREHLESVKISDLLLAGGDGPLPRAIPAGQI